MAFLVLLVVFLVLGAAGMRWGVDTREHHNNWDRV
jgi:hypothetical protein